MLKYIFTRIITPRRAAIVTLSLLGLFLMLVSAYTLLSLVGPESSLWTIRVAGKGVLVYITGYAGVALAESAIRLWRRRGGF